MSPGSWSQQVEDLRLQTRCFLVSTVAMAPPAWRTGTHSAVKPGGAAVGCPGVIWPSSGGPNEKTQGVGGGVDHKLSRSQYMTGVFKGESQVT